MTQAQRILELLKERGPKGASNFELMRISYQYPARIHTLRHKEGHNIVTKHIKDKEWRITLEDNINESAGTTVTEEPAHAVSWWDKDNL